MSNINWEEFFMMSAVLASYRSKDPCTKVGCVIVDNNNRIISSGYNGFPNGIHDSLLPWTKDSDIFEENKYAYVVHAEINSILNSYTTELKNYTLYTTLFPCHECTKAIIQKGINNIVYYNIKDVASTEASKKMLNLAGVKYRQYNSITNISLTLS